jgi:AraC family transcriptional activator of pobA
MDQRSDIGLSAPAALWLPLGAGGRFQLPAGSEGFAASIAEDVTWRVIGGNAAAQDLRVLLDRAAIVTSERLAPNLPELSVSMTVLLRETREQLPGGSTMIDLHLGLVLIQLWRIAAGAVSAPARRSAGLTTAQAFSQLIEAHFREDLTVADYAARLGVSRAHLNGACLRAAERTPLAMINQRRIEEAKLRLRQSKLSVEEVGYALGFRDPGYFNRFFKRMTGQRPGAYRQMAAAPAVMESFAAWP